MNARTMATVLVCLAVVLAGCGSVLDSAKERAKDAAEDAASDALNDSGVGDLADVPTNVTMIGFGFDRPETYTYEIVAGQGYHPTSESQQLHGRLIVTVKEVSDGTVTLTARYELNGETIERTFSGTQQDVAVKVGMFTPSTNTTPAMMTMRTQTTLALTLGQTLYLVEHELPLVGALSQVGDDNKTMTYKAAGTDSYAGVECSVTVLSINGTRSAKSCVSTDHGLPVYVVFYDETGTPEMWLKLVEYE